MSAQYTPGPWHWTEYDNATEEMPRLVNAEGVQVCDFGRDTNYYPSEGTPPEDADAALIAAAPDLLAALRGICQLSPDDSSTDWNVALNEGCAAIAKATRYGA